MPREAGFVLLKFCKRWGGVSHWMSTNPVTLSGGPDLVQEAFDLSAQVAALRRQRYGEAVNLLGRAARVGRATIDVRRAARRRGRPPRSLLHIAGNFLRRRPLLFDSRRNRARNFGNPGDGAPYLRYCRDRMLGSGLHLRHLGGDLLGRLGGLR